MTALRRQAALRVTAHPDGRLEGLVFARPGGTPLRPQWVLDQLRKRTAELNLPRIGLHGLRHTAAGIMIAENIPLAIVSKPLRHSTLATTINLYGHLLKDSADEAVTALASALDKADSTWPAQHSGPENTGPLPFAAQPAKSAIEGRPSPVLSGGGWPSGSRRPGTSPGPSPSEAPRRVCPCAASVLAAGQWLP
ncbi:tyrosine-type recombinase/integrase [Kitasatospora sp. GAS204B]|uniref:tyrosine-type recombinase/integrase n=1 Tax=unclassified Kitasatospora TaxID=2633591 RepID=UPI002475AFE8|nr:tyrosine-type recombinase/integrase [Kitasatospora sp. GAS204B]MDH6118942.1 hypothetical protein [Kitasatospora sp. GAS204B]